MARIFEARFGVLADDGARSTTFGIWAPKNKNELYITARAVGGLLKGTIHYEGTGSSPRHFGYTMEAVRELQRRSAPLNRSRHFVEFTGETLRPGVTVECRICIPRSALRIMAAPKGSEKVMWVPAPPHGFMLDLSLTVAPADAVIDWEQQKEIGAHKLAEGRLADSRRVFLLYHHTPESELEPALRDMTAKFQADGVKVASIQGSHRLLAFDVHSKGYLAMVDFAADTFLRASDDGSENLGPRGVRWPTAKEGVT